MIQTTLESVSFGVESRDWITRLSDGIQNLMTAVCREEDSVQNGELLSG